MKKYPTFEEHICSNEREPVRIHIYKYNSGFGICLGEGMGSALYVSAEKAEDALFSEMGFVVIMFLRVGESVK